MALKYLFKETRELLGTNRNEFISSSASKLSSTGFSTDDEGLQGQTEVTTSSQSTINNKSIAKEVPLLDECEIINVIMPSLNSPQIMRIKRVNIRFENKIIYFIEIIIHLV